MVPCKQSTNKCPQHELIETLKSDKKRLLSGNDKNKKFWRKIATWEGIVILIIMSALVMTVVYGPKDGIRKVVDKIPLTK